jgi:hypothetical protein
VAPNASTVDSRSAFVDFAKQLSDWVAEHPDDVENVTVESFLEAMSAWVADMEGVFVNRGEETPKDVPWGFFAQTLLAACAYE